MKRAGFSLIEMLLYVALLSMLAVVTFSWMNRYVHNINSTKKKTHQLMVLQTVLQRLAADIQMAEPAENRWTIKDRFLMFYIGGTAISWHQEKDKLYRIENKAKALIATQITAFNGSLCVKKSCVKAVDCKLKAGDFSINQKMRVYNG